MSVPILPDDAAVGPPERLHPLFLVTGVGGSLRQMAGAFAGVGYFAVSGRPGLAISLAIAVLAFTAIANLLRWTRFSFRVGANEIRIDSGILNRTHRSVPFGRIHDVDISQGVAARLFGLAQVKFETGGSAGEEEGVLPVIALERAREIRTLIRTRRSNDASVAEAAAAPEAELPPIYEMSAGRLLLAGSFNFSLAVFAGLFGISQTAGEALGFDPLSREFWRGVVSPDSPAARYVVEHRASAIIAGALLLIVIGLATGIVRTVVRDFGFRLQRTEAGLRRRRGLLTRTDVTLPTARVQAIVLRSGPLRDRFGWSALTVQSLARDDAATGDHVLAPLATREEVGSIIGELAWRHLPAAPNWTRVSRTYVWTRAVVVAPLILMALVQALAEPRIGALVAIVLAGLIAVRWLEWRRTAYALDGDRLLIRVGWWRRRLVVLPTAKIQSIDVVETLVSRWFGTASLHFGVAGGGNSIPAIPRRKARELREQLLG